MGRKANPIVSKNEEQFQIALSQEDWVTVWNCLHFACSNLTKKILKNVYQNEIDEIITDATIYSFDRVKNKGVKPKKLSSWCWFNCFRYVYDPKRVAREKNEIQLPEDSEEYIENSNITEEDDTIYMIQDRAVYRHKLIAEASRLTRTYGIDSYSTILEKIAKLMGDEGWTFEDAVDSLEEYYKHGKK